MPDVEKSIDLNVPVHTAYNQWTQFEEFPRFMEGVHEVRQLDDKRLHWRAEIAGRDKEWDAEITDQTPDQRIAWRSTSGAENGGAALFEPIGANKTRLTMRIDYNPDDFVETVGGALGFVGRRVQGDLERFKEFIEARGEETGAWRGEIHGKEVEGDGSSTAKAYGETATGSRASSNFSREGEMERRSAGGHTAGTHSGESASGRAFRDTGADTTSGFDERDMAREHGEDIDGDAERDQQRRDRAA
jgi:hypothetical protein